MFHNKTVSVVLATYRERDSIRKVIEQFFETGAVDEVLVVSNNAEAGTIEEVQKTAAKLVFETQQGYGYAFRKGIQEARGDYIVLCEPDGSFVPQEIRSFLEEAANIPVVLGSRTSGNTTMSPLRRFGNVVAAKTIQILFGIQSLGDIGCTYKLFHKEALKLITPRFQRTDPLFATELVLLVAVHRIPFKEIPVTFKERVGTSAITSSWYKWFWLGIQVFFYTLLFKIQSIFKTYDKD